MPAAGAHPHRVEHAAGGEPIGDRGWYDRPSAEVARDLLGCTIVHASSNGTVAGRLVEVEAYAGPEDLAAHSARGRTPRNEVMFGAPGHLYVYLIYGLHHCANVVCGPADKPEAVLLRAAQITRGLELARRRRGNVRDARLASGPGNLGAAFGFDRSMNGTDLLGDRVWLERGPAPKTIAERPRIGVDYAGPWATRPLRFLDPDDEHVSRS
jgi:DNA-3-methyladenine glycosylase